MFDRNLVLRLALALFPLVGALVLASFFARHFEPPSMLALVLAILVGGVILVVMRSGRS
jgi:uncharacterized integral membrane protein